MSDNSGTISNYGIQTQTSYMMGNTNLRGSNIPQSNDTSLQSVVNSANENIVELNNINIGLSSNLNQEILVKKDELIKLQNEDLTNQLRNLEAIESNIENKNSFLINYLNDYDTIDNVTVSIYDYDLKLISISNNFSFTLEIYETIDILKETLINTKTNNVVTTNAIP